MPFLMEKPVQRLLTPEEVAEILCTNERSVMILLRGKELTGTKVGKFWRIDPADLAEFIERNKNRS